MTVNSTATRELDIDRVVLRSLQLAGLRAPEQGETGGQWESQASMARDFLEMTVDALQAEGVFARSVNFIDQAVVASQATYTDLPSATLDLVGDGMYLPTGQTTGETPVVQIDREAYHRLSNKTSEGRPTRYYLERAATLKVYLWPVPDVAGTITYQQHRLLGDNDDGSKTLDLQRYWTDYICWELAHKLSVAAGFEPNRCGYVRSQAEKALKTAKIFANQHPDTQMHMTHRTGWSRR